jgi:hypothetical protein
MGPIGCPETSVKDWYSTLRSTPEERGSHEHCGESLKSRIGTFDSVGPHHFSVTCKKLDVFVIVHFLPFIHHVHAVIFHIASMHFLQQQ